MKEALDVNPRNVTRWVSFAIAILSLGLPAFIGGAIEGQPLFSIGRALVLTVPLTVSLAIIAHQWWPGAGRSLHPLAACFVIIIAGSWGLSLGLPGSLTPADVAKKDCVDASRIYQREGAKICALKEPLVKAPSWLPAREIVTPALSYLAGYWKVYGPTRFITSVVVALYLAYVVDHYLKL